ncbi:hypothetical protein [Nocardioides sp. NPDC127503]
MEADITDLGRSLQPVFAVVGNWSEANMPAVETARQAYAGPLPR